MAYEGGLRRWFKENWIRTDTGEPCGSGDSVGESGKYCRPTRRINKKTPRTTSEISKKKLRKIMRKKKRLANKGKAPDKVQQIRKV